ncbi:hypothetical protein RWE15_04025 [Virgibacillus halophilus]|uniref:Sodium:solute symporter family protein n=1 Tax=Tigheibacillus halophilus TaxID=361280 RepID=A0ABU5C389_9BACI|nr:hypothetical protein [Virgibacillus halophilus]
MLFLITSGSLPAVDPSYAQRLLSARSEREGQKGLFVFGIVYLLLMTLILTVGMYGAGLRPHLENPDQILLIMAQDYLPLFGKALFLTAVAAAAMSTVSSYLNVTAGLIVKNLILELVPDLSQKKQIFWARICTVIVAVITLSFAPIASNGLAVAAVAAQVILIAAMGPLIYLILFWRRLTERAAFWGTLITTVVTFVLMIVVGGPNAAVLGPGLFGLPVQFWGFIVAGITFGGLSFTEAYSTVNLAPKFQSLFSTKSQRVRISKKPIMIVCTMWFVLFIPWGYMKITGTQFAFPVLSGKFSFFSDVLLLAAAAIVFVVSIYLIIYLIKFLRGNKYEDVDNQVKKQHIN